jgi:hypothetical protein
MAVRKPKILDTGLRRHDDISFFSDHRLNSTTFGVGVRTRKSSCMRKSLLLKQIIQLLAGLSGLICCLRRRRPDSRRKVIAEISPILYRHLLRKRFGALIWRVKIVLLAIEAAVDVGAAFYARIVSENFFVENQFLAAMVTREFLHDCLP